MEPRTLVAGRNLRKAVSCLEPKLVDEPYIGHSVAFWSLWPGVVNDASTRQNLRPEAPPTLTVSSNTPSDEYLEMASWT